MTSLRAKRSNLILTDIFNRGIYITAPAEYNAKRKGRRMWERFTEKARRVIVLAQEEANQLGHNYVGTEHILLALTKEKQNIAAKTLIRMGVNLEVLRHTIEAVVQRGIAKPSEEKVFTPATKIALELAFDEARLWNHDYIGTEHLLLGLIRGQSYGKASRILLEIGVSLEMARMQISEILGSEPISYKTSGSQLLSQTEIETLLKSKHGKEMQQLIDERQEIKRQKEDAIHEQNYLEAAILRDKEKQIIERIRQLEAEFSEIHESGAMPGDEPKPKSAPQLCPHCGKDIHEPPEEKKESQ